jgi:hypothetical protein
MFAEGDIILTPCAVELSNVFIRQDELEESAGTCHGMSLQHVSDFLKKRIIYDPALRLL